MKWNYRVCTKLHKYPKHDELVRLFSIYSVYYENGTPCSYGVVDVNGVEQPQNPVSNWEDFGDLHGTHKLIKTAFKKPILDLDNFPTEYIDKTVIKYMLKTPKLLKHIKSQLTTYFNKKDYSS